MFNKLISYAVSSDIPIYLCENIMCRLCGCMGNNMSFVFLKESCYLIKMIQDETKIKIQENDVLPRTVCRSCVDKIHLIKHFKAHCRKTQKVLENMFKDKSSQDNLPLENTLSLEGMSNNNENEENSEMIVEWLEDAFTTETESVISENISEQKLLINNNEYGIMYNNANIFKNVHITLENKNLSSDAKIIPNSVNKILGQTKRRRVQTYSAEELSLINKNKNVNKIKNNVEKKEKYEEQIIHENSYLKLNEAESNGPLLYRLLTSDKKNSYEENYDDLLLKQNNTEIIDEIKEDVSPNQKTDRSGRVFISSSHKYVKKESEQEYSCKICNSKFRYPFQVDLHVRKHIGELPFTCKYCEKSFITGFYLLKHEMTHKNTQFTCEFCGKTFRRLYNLKDHQRIHTDSSPAFKCNICNKQFFTKGNFDAHKLIHAEKKHICEICGKLFALHAIMKRHQNRHKDDTYQCQLCPKLSRTKEEYYQHRKRHDRNGLFKCDTCSLSFWTKKGLQMHDRMYHKNENYSEVTTIDKNI